MESVEPWRALAHPAPLPKRFSGPVFIHEVHGSEDPIDLEVLAVFFEPGARTVPHVHETGQLLYFLDGEGIVGAQGERRLFGAGGMAHISAGEWHWHGATPTSATSHLSIRPGGPSSWPPDVPMLDWETYMSGARAG